MGKEENAVTGIFSFSHNVFKRGHKKMELFGKGLKIVIWHRVKEFDIWLLYRCAEKNFDVTSSFKYRLLLSMQSPIEHTLMSKDILWMCTSFCMNKLLSC